MKGGRKAGGGGRSPGFGNQRPEEYLGAVVAKQVEDAIADLNLSTGSDTPTVTVPTGVPATPRNPFVLGLRVDPKGEFHANVGLFINPNIDDEVKAIVRKRRKNGTYGTKTPYPLSDITDAERFAGTLDREIGPLDPNRTYDLTRLIGPVSGTKLKNPSLDSNVATTPATNTQLAQIVTGSSLVGVSGRNESMNSSFKFSRLRWNRAFERDAMGVIIPEVENQDDGPRGSATEAQMATQLAKWRFDADPNLFILSTPLTGTRWNKAESTLIIQDFSPAPTARLEKRAFDAGEVAYISFIARKRGAGTIINRRLDVYLTDDGAGGAITESPSQTGWILDTLTSQWSLLKGRMVVLSGYTPLAGAGGRQWLRFILNGSLQAEVEIDRVYIAHNDSTWSAHPKDHAEERGAPDGGGKGNAGGHGQAGYAKTEYIPVSGTGGVIVPDPDPND